MKTRALFLMMFASLMWIGCSSDNDPVSVDDPAYAEGTKAYAREEAETKPVFSREGGSSQLTFTATGPWKVTNVPSWVQVSPMNGEAGQHTLTINVDERSITDDDHWRHASIKVGGDLGFFTIEVSQSARNEVIGPLALDLTASPVRVYVQVLGDCYYNDIQISDDAQSWIKSINSYAGSWVYLPQLIFDIKPNETGKARKGEIVITRNGLSHKVVVRQSAEGDIRPILMELYQATGGDSWRHNDNWGSDKPLNDWFGLNVDEQTNELYHIGLNENNLNGYLPESIGQLTSLRDICIGGNGGLKGNLPESLGNLVNLEGLAIHYNSIEGTIPASLGKLKNLHILCLNHNQLSGKIPEELGLSSLWGIQLQENNLEGGIPESFAQIPNLGQFYIYGNRLNGPASSAISEWLQHVNDPRLGPQQEGFEFGIEN